MKLLVKETVWREISFKPETTKEQIVDYIEENGAENIYDAAFYEGSEICLDTATEISPSFNQEGFSTVEILNDDQDTIYSNTEN